MYCTYSFKTYSLGPISATLVFLFQAIAHYEQAADYYKGEESTR